MEESYESFEIVVRVLLITFFVAGMFFVIRYAVGLDTDWNIMLGMITLGFLGLSIVACIGMMLFGPLLALLFLLAEQLIIPIFRWFIRRARA